MALIYTIFPVLAALLGTAVALRYAPGPRVESAIQHLAAGVVFAAAGAEILPDVLHSGDPVPTFVGGLLGVIVMLGVRRLEGLVSGPVGMLSAIGVDVFIDGLVLGIGFSADLRTGLLLTVALTLELVLLGLTSTAALAGALKSVWLRLLAVTGLVLLLPVGVLVAAPVSSLLGAIQTGLLSFGLMALLYLVTEELLLEAHQTEEPGWVTALFFAGFLALLLLDEVMQGGT